MIRINRGKEVEPYHEEFEYHAADRIVWPLVCGKSRQPLLDACRQLKSLYGVTQKAVGLFNEGSEAWDMRCSVDVGAATTVQQTQHSAPRFVPFTEFKWRD